ncbi:MAG: hypothetical protein K6G67_00415, partial [Lachnospiraceae bacterium]|nr:hypothetical protein [Lachnospiraceae bacterium]
MKKLSDFLNKHINIVIPVAALVLFFIAGAGTMLVLKHFGSVNASRDESVEASDQDDKESGAEDAADNKVSDENNSEAGDDGGEENLEVDAEESPRLMVCVPLEEMHLRRNPGSNANDTIASMTAGEKITWDGKYETANGNTYYHVKLSDGTEGYAVADYLVPVYYENDDDSLDIVETDDALYTYDLMVSDIKRLVQRYGDVLIDSVFGQSADGRDIHCMFLGNRNAKHHIFVQASIHGREYMNTQLVMKLVEYYCHELDTGSINDRKYRELFDDVCICIVPMTNPDGVTIAQNGIDSINDPDLRIIPQYCYEWDKEYMTASVDEYGDAYWIDHYKETDYNRSVYPPEFITYEQYLKQWKSNARGVDLNNNFDGNWNTVQLKSHPSYSSCKGDYALSEPESSALSELATETDYDMYLSYHSKGEIIYYDTEGNLPEVSVNSLSLAKLASGQIRYRIKSNKTATNVNQGGFGDWVQLALNKP